MKNYYFLFLSLLASNFMSAAVLSESSFLTVPTMPTLSNVAVCDDNNDGFSVFDLSVQNSVIFSAQGSAASNFEITYHEDITGAQTGSNPISGVTAYYNISPNSQTIYVRVTDVNTSEYSVGSFVLVVHNRPFVGPLSSLNFCDIDSNPTNGMTAVNLTLQTQVVLSQQPLPSSNYTVTYFATQVNAQAGVSPIINSSNYVATNGQTIWVRVENIATGCFGVGSFGVVVNLLPQILQPTYPVFQLCNFNSPNSGFEIFDLASQIPNILLGQTGMMVEFYPSLLDAQNGTNVITNLQYQNTFQYIQTLGIRIVNTSTGCSAISTMDIRVEPVPYIANAMSDFMSCDGVDGLNDGSMFYQNNPLGLADYIDDVLGTIQTTSYYHVSFYTSLNDAQSGLNAISNLSTYQVQTGTYYVRVAVIETGCYVLDSFNVVIEQLAELNITSSTASGVACVDWDSTEITNGLTLSSGVSASNYSFNWYLDATLITGETGAELSISNISSNENEYSVFAISNSTFGCVSNPSNFTVVRSGVASNSAAVITNLSGVQSITVTNNGFGMYHFQLDDGLILDNGGFFENVSLGSHTINIIDVNGCGSTSLSVELVESEVSAPIGNSLQSFAPGATLADLVVNGVGVQWYSSATGTVPLPLTTLLVDGVTYYATQTINAVESAARLAVTVQVSLGLNENEVLSLFYSPNPVENLLTLQSNETLKSIEVYNLLGQKVFEQFLNGFQFAVDLSEIRTGYYLATIKGDKGQKVVRILKR